MRSHVRVAVIVWILSGECNEEFQKYSFINSFLGLPPIGSRPWF
jgi:hypothetical protein